MGDTATGVFEHTEPVPYLLKTPACVVHGTFRPRRVRDRTRPRSEVLGVLVEGTPGLSCTSEPPD